MDLSRNNIKFIRSLSLKKNRDKYNVFIAEGIKLVEDLLPYFKCKLLVVTSQWLVNHALIKDTIVVSDLEMRKISNLTTPPDALAVFHKKDVKLPDFNNKSLYLALDTIQDPGNLGTIVRIADWFGIKHIFCSYETVDIYNTKTIQATMGALSRVNIHYVDLIKLISHLRELKWPIYGTLLDGKSVYECKLSDFGIIVMGNEGNGLSENLRQLVTDRLLIPSFPVNEITSESLNVAVSTGIICSEFRRLKK